MVNKITSISIDPDFWRSVKIFCVTNSKEMSGYITERIKCDPEFQKFKLQKEGKN